MRLRSDASFAIVEEGMIVRHGAEESMLIEGARGVDDAREELDSRGLLTDGRPADDWRGVLAVPPEARVFLAAGPAVFADALRSHGLFGDDADSPAALFVEEGIDLPARASFNRASLARGRVWLWVQRPSLDELRWCSFAPGETACAECLEKRLLGNRRNVERYSAALSSNAGVLPTAAMPALTSLATGIVVLECARLLSGGAPGSLGRLTSFDMARWSLESERVLPIPGCEACTC